MLKSPRKKTHFDPRLACGVLRLSYDFETRAGEIYFPQAHCCDMSGCIKLFAAIDPEAVSIQTFSGDRPDTSYHRDSGGSSDWSAFLPR